MVVNNSRKSFPDEEVLKRATKSLRGYFVDGQWHVVLDIDDSKPFNGMDVTHLLRSFQMIQRKFQAEHRRRAIAAEQKRNAEFHKQVEAALVKPG